MAITDFPGLWLPAPGFGTSGAIAPAFTDVTINASGDRLGWVIQIPQSGTLDWAEFRIGTFTQATNGLRVSFQTVDVATGFPNGTQSYYRDITAGLASASWQVPPGIMTTDGTNLGTPLTVTQGQWLGVVVDFVSFAASDSVAITSTLSVEQPNQFNYVANGSSGSYSKNNGAPHLALRYSDGSYAQFPNAPAAVVPVVSVDTRSFNSGSAPDERGLRFTVPVTCRLAGMWVRIDLDNAADVVLYDSDGTTVLAGPKSLDAGIRVSSVASLGVVVFDAAVTLTAGSAYRLAVKPTTVGNVTVYDGTVNATALLGAIPGGATWYATARTDAGAWTDTDTIRPWMGILIDGIDVSGGSGGGETAHVFIG